MKIIEPSYEILRCPDGEECLAVLERVGRVAYKSEDKIDTGRDPCNECVLGVVVEKVVQMDVQKRCPRCEGRQWVQAREPSSHKLIRAILKTDRREKLAKKVRDHFYGKQPMVLEVFSREVVNMVMDELRDDPPHESVIEHEIISVKFIFDRGVSHEMVRHRLCAFTQESTRYVNYHKGKHGSEIGVINPCFWEDDSGPWQEWARFMEQAEGEYMEHIKRGAEPQEARSVLTNSLKTEIVVTANLRQWRLMLKLRTSPRAHPQMRQVMQPLLEELRGRIPIIFEEV